MPPEPFDPDLELLDALPHAAWVASPDGDVWYLNAHGREFTGWDSALVRELGWRGAMHPEDAPAMAAVWARAMADLEPYVVEFRIRRHDGAFRWHVERAAPYRAADGTVHCWLGTCTDVHDRKVADEELAQVRRQVDEQLALIDALQENAPIGMGFLDTDLRLVRANRVMIESRGGPLLDDVIGRRVDELVPADVWAQLAPILARVLERTETVTDVPLSAPDPDEPTRVRQWSVSYYPVVLDGEVIGIGTVALEETERLDRIAELQSSEELRALAERAGSLGSWEYDLVEGTSRWSPGLREVLGVDRDTASSWQSFAALLVPEDRPRYAENLQQLLTTGGAGTYRYRLALPEGGERIVEARAACDTEAGRVVRVFGTTQDVTESVERTERVAQVERLLTEAEAMAEMGSFETQLPSGETLFSPGLRRLLGYGADGPIDPETWRRYIHPDDRALQDRMLARLLETGQMDTFQLRVTVVGGDERRLEIRGSCYRGPDGQPTRLIGTALDITERERLRSERVELLERSLTAADHERRRIAEHLHDDAVQALTATLLRVDHALATGTTEPLARARRTLEAAVRSLRLNIMELAPVDLLEDGVEAAIAAYAEQLLELDGVEVVLEIDLDDDEADLDRHLLTSYRIIREALANVRLHAGARQVVVALRREDDRLTGEVRDDGVGVTDDPSTRPGHLGLHLMRQRAELLGGEVTVTARTPEPGTVVRWWLPL